MIYVIASMLVLCAACAAICVVWARHAQFCVQRAVVLEQRALPYRARVTALETDHEALRLQVQRFQGRFYALKQAIEEDREWPLEPPDPPTSEPPAPSAQHPVCENWLLAKYRGPASDAASCECGYCVGKRAERAATKERLVPKSQAARIQAMRDGLAQP